ncbi:flavodoxin-dependent (E)-4-hydroxy-3-methylbut-2-enyl-diphosphate synthase [Tissierella carlieri]|uniref:4-hydroxy-3-methylbut-2-en-1-yl diphosphate synthase (flavodoxin) n=1 Tax=Tissierella carlieri TaxID=689904 RepID=A0ABT1S5L4_9FIRM|nr:flavodoxin-dependent (E)-4-hydroxy-3-methylbut-2-enyl-diphosphate synthase [Tissierella carlieri]MBU5314264.1 flavodoxin-dependent (E)-4-hydroxy-3-methylbut-2-enyl-diphosphate synthase [Tissierella carlieri]MCQ4921756.1 flavodoxin-dependent (E)-4-hydroxy-3-methylbut-2-enyl-diphosphate synthase [Tissierella carlieri]
MIRKKTKVIKVGNVLIGGDNPISIQSMTNTLTKDIVSTINQIKKLEDAGCDIIRSAITDLEDAKAIKEIKRQINIPIIADIQYDYRLALESIKYGTDGLRLNPGNIGSLDKVKEVVKACKENNISIRVGVNAGSLKKEFLEKYNGVNEDSMVYSALEQIRLLEDMDFYDIKISLKASNVPLTIKAYEKMSNMVDYPLHLGITEAGPIWRGTVKSSVGIGALLSMGIGDTVRISLTGDPVEEVKVGREILKSLNLLNEGIEIISCPTCGRTNIDLINIVEEAEKRLEGINKHIKVAIMGCAVNGPGEAREADIGIAGGKGEGLIFRKGEIIKKVREENLLDELLKEIEKL